VGILRARNEVVVLIIWHLCVVYSKLQWDIIEPLGVQSMVVARGVGGGRGKRAVEINRENPLHRKHL
jgi:hypothetical protein